MGSIEDIDEDPSFIGGDPCDEVGEVQLLERIPGDDHREGNVVVLGAAKHSLQCFDGSTAKDHPGGAGIDDEPLQVVAKVESEDVPHEQSPRFSTLITIEVWA